MKFRSNPHPDPLPYPISERGTEVDTRCKLPFPSPPSFGGEDSGWLLHTDRFTLIDCRSALLGATGF